MFNNPHNKSPKDGSTQNKKTSEYLENEVDSLYSTLGIAHEYPNNNNQDNPIKDVVSSEVIKK